jgi:hypothetical protein
MRIASATWLVRSPRLSRVLASIHKVLAAQLYTPAAVFPVKPLIQEIVPSVTTTGSHYFQEVFQPGLQEAFNKSSFDAPRRAPIGRTRLCHTLDWSDGLNGIVPYPYQARRFAISCCCGACTTMEG